MIDNYSGDFGPFGKRVWINCAHQGPMPHAAVEEAREVITWKIRPCELSNERFMEVPRRLKAALARLTGVSESEIILGNSASYGIHLLANGFRWRKGDEVLLVRGDFPSNILPWLGLKEKGVHVRQLDPAAHLPDSEELRKAITAKTRVFCVSWVHSFSGFVADIKELGTVCRERDIVFILNASQGLGARILDLKSLPIDALVSVGFKWLCGPYGTGFCWIKPELVKTLEYNQLYWLSEITADDLARENGGAYVPAEPPSARTYDVFGTANFFNFKPWAASIEYLLKRGIDHIAAHDQRLVSELIKGLNTRKYSIISPTAAQARSTLVFISYRDPARNTEIMAKLGRAGIDISIRRNKLRISPHIHNTSADIEKLLTVLESQ